MNTLRATVLGLLGALVLTAVPVRAEAAPEPIDPATYSDLRQTLRRVARPTIEHPAWIPAGKTTAFTKPAAFDMTYSIETRGALTASVTEFRRLAEQTLSDPRGWMRTGVRFQEVPSDGQFKLTLIEAGQLPLISSGCDSFYSCRVGMMVLINQDRWMGATPSWNSQKGTLRDYRHMVINHEVGHWLGHGHETCVQKGGPAAVMQQQSIDLEGCRFNPWPLESEIASTKQGGAAWDGL